MPRTRTARMTAPSRSCVGAIRRSHWMWFVFPQIAGLGLQRHVAAVRHLVAGRGEGVSGASGARTTAEECAGIVAQLAGSERGADLRRHRRAEAAVVHDVVPARRTRRAGVPAGARPVLRWPSRLGHRPASLTAARPCAGPAIAPVRGVHACSVQAATVGACVPVPAGCSPIPGRPRRAPRLTIQASAPDRQDRHQRIGGVAVARDVADQRRADEQQRDRLPARAPRRAARPAAAAPRPSRGRPAAAGPARRSPAARSRSGPSRSARRGPRRASPAGAGGGSARPPSARGPCRPRCGRRAAARPSRRPSARTAGASPGRSSPGWRRIASMARLRIRRSASAGVRPSSRRSRVWIALPDEPLSAACWRIRRARTRSGGSSACRAGS